jgi:glycolate oxidase FAD binding subunit
LDWGPALDPNHAVLSCQHLNQVIDHAVDDLTITVEAGLPLVSLQRLLAAQDQWLPVDWPRGVEPITADRSDDGSDSRAGSIGGLIARGLSGGLRQRHLGIRDQIIGIGLLRSDGTAAKAGGRVVKNVAGYDLMRLLCGSWGSLALITEVTLRVQPIRPAHAGLLVTGELANLEHFRAALLLSTLTPERCDWQCHGDGSWALRLVLSSVSDQAVLDQLTRIQALAAEHGLHAEAMLCSSPLDVAMSCHEPAQLLRLVLPAASLHQLIASEAMASLNGWSWELAAGAGCGDGWCSSAAPAFQIEALRRQVASLSGQLMVLVQPGDQQVSAWTDTPARPVIEAVKRQFDPRQQLSRGRLPGVDQFQTRA